MKAKTINAIWGIVLILAGGLFLAQNAGWIGEPPEQLWKFIFAGLSLLFFASYFINGVTQWGWLFPACIFGALSVITFMGENRSESPLLGSLLMWSIAAPFLVADHVVGSHPGFLGLPDLAAQVADEGHLQLLVLLGHGGQTDPLHDRVGVFDAVTQGAD